MLSRARRGHRGYPLAGVTPWGHPRDPTGPRGLPPSDGNETVRSPRTNELDPRSPLFGMGDKSDDAFLAVYWGGGGEGE